MIRKLGDYTPKIADTAWVSEFAYVVGNVEIREFASIWPGVTIRGDGPTTIVIGNHVNVQEGSVVHGDGLVIEDHVSVGHCVVVHCDRVGEGSLLGSFGSTRDRRIEHLHPPFGESRRHLLGARGAVARRVDQDASLAHRGGEAVRAENNFLDLGRVGEHCEYHV